MYFVTRWFVLDELEKDPNLTFEQLKFIFPLASNKEILEGIKEYKDIQYK